MKISQNEETLTVEYRIKIYVVVAGWLGPLCSVNLYNEKSGEKFCRFQNLHYLCIAIKKTMTP